MRCYASMSGIVSEKGIGVKAPVKCLHRWAGLGAVAPESGMNGQVMIEAVGDIGLKYVSKSGLRGFYE